MDFQILTYNNQVGILYDAILLNNLLLSIGYNTSIKFLHELNDECKATVGVWIQNFDEKYLCNFKTNIFFINEEWVDDYYLSKLKDFDIVICKTKYARMLLKPYCNTIVLPFISRNLLDRRIPRNNNFLHFKGKSIQKNTELINDILPYQLIHIIDSNQKYESDETISYLLNSHKIHLCISLYESWGHYLFEGLSTGNEIICTDIPSFTENLDPSLVHFVPTKSKKNSNYIFDRESRFTIRQSFHVDKNIMVDLINNFRPIGKSEERIKMFDDLMKRNTNRLMSFFNTVY